MSAMGSFAPNFTRGFSAEEISYLRGLIGHAAKPVFYGKYAGVVTDNEDPKEIGRIRAQVPAVLGEEEPCGWALPCAVFGGGKDRGLFALPDVGDTVWIEFQGGDPSLPIWTGTFWSAPSSTGQQDDLGSETGTESPEGPDNPAAPGQTILKTSGGHVLSFDDEGGIVVIAEASGAEIRLTGDGEVLVTADTILLGADAEESLVLGDAFKELFNNHTHPTGVGPSGTPTDIMGSSHLSSVSKTE